MKSFHVKRNVLNWEIGNLNYSAVLKLSTQNVLTFPSHGSYLLTHGMLSETTTTKPLVVQTDQSFIMPEEVKKG